MNPKFWITKPCLECGSLFSAKRSHVKNGKGKYCSKKCGQPKGSRHWLYSGKDRMDSIREWRGKFPERKKAHQAVYDAIKKGTLNKLPCSVCGEMKSEAHHEDYSKKLDVIWLCRKHHREADKRLGIGSKDFK